MKEERWEWKGEKESMVAKGNTAPLVQWDRKERKEQQGIRGREVKKVKWGGPDSWVSQAHLAPEGCRVTVVYLALLDLKEDLGVTRRTATFSKSAERCFSLSCIYCCRATSREAVPRVKAGLDLLVLQVQLGTRDSGVLLDLVDPGDSRAVLVGQGTLVSMG